MLLTESETGARTSNLRVRPKPYRAPYTRTQERSTERPEINAPLSCSKRLESTALQRVQGRHRRGGPADSLFRLLR